MAIRLISTGSTRSSGPSEVARVKCLGLHEKMFGKIAGFPGAYLALESRSIRLAFEGWFKILDIVYIEERGSGCWQLDDGIDTKLGRFSRVTEAKMKGIKQSFHTYTLNETTHTEREEDEILTVRYEDGRWSKPYYDCGGGNIWMLTYTVPFFGYVNDTYFFKGTSGIDIDLRRLDIDQCPLPPGSTQLNIFAASDKCKKRTTECIAIPGLGFRRGSYRCICKRGFYYPDTKSTSRYYNGTVIEEEYENLMMLLETMIHFGVEGITIVKKETKEQSRNYHFFSSDGECAEFCGSVPEQQISCLPQTVGMRLRGKLGFPDKKGLEMACGGYLTIKSWEVLCQMCSTNVLTTKSTAKGEITISLAY
ncbi:hypothetical protein WN48_06671 [Eufriesea mexicana]|uniref:GPR158/179 extracellular domain-containing protein n=1 Tax=Eufriesea mexicana TaxID=516756 RepID=A0A310SGD0_9HYME|nr:hypothetical protein WN48_06671 [Eufriesea mexicana]